MDLVQRTMEPLLPEPERAIGQLTSEVEPASAGFAARHVLAVRETEGRATALDRMRVGFASLGRIDHR